MCPGVGFLDHDHMVALFSVFQFSFPPTMWEGSLFTMPSSAFIVCRFYDDGHSHRCEVIPCCSFDLHFSNNASLLAQRVKCLPTMQETWVRSLGWKDSPGEGNGNPLQYTCLENPMDGEAW